MKKLAEKKTNNKGFSLVELIIVIAIMAVLIGVLAPQYMRYLEKSRLGKDNSAIDSVKTSIEAALTDEGVYTDTVTVGADITLTFSGTGYSWSANAPASLKNEVAATVAAADGKVGSKTYTKAGATAPTLVIGTDLKVTTGGGYTTTPTN